VGEGSDGGVGDGNGEAGREAAVATVVGGDGGMMGESEVGDVVSGAGRITLRVGVGWTAGTERDPQPDVATSVARKRPVTKKTTV
jgi:hypothetical protein